VKEPLEAFGRRFFQQIGETVEGRRPITEEAKKRCLALGQELRKPEKRLSRLTQIGPHGKEPCMEELKMIYIGGPRLCSNLRVCGSLPIHV